MEKQANGLSINFLRTLVHLYKNGEVDIAFASEALEAGIEKKKKIPSSICSP